MRRLSHVFAFMMLISFLTAPVTFAHPANFHLITDFQEHIEAHLDSFNAALSEGFITSIQAQEQLEQLAHHLDRFVELFPEYSREIKFVQKSSEARDVLAVVDGLKQLQATLQLRS